ncbi:MAG: hypothetical protein LR011_12065, partial [Verrucomicrobia bacterium]|nr:hypothetical protein [Verrucomicrobiota bacterium]
MNLPDHQAWTRPRARRVGRMVWMAALIAAGSLVSARAEDTPPSFDSLVAPFLWRLLPRLPQPM